MLDDVRVLYYNCDTRTFIRRGNTTNEDTVFDSNLLLSINDQIQASFVRKLAVATQNLNKTDSKYSKIYMLFFYFYWCAFL